MAKRFFCSRNGNLKPALQIVALLAAIQAASFLFWFVYALLGFSLNNNPIAANMLLYVALSAVVWLLFTKLNRADASAIGFASGINRLWEGFGLGFAAITLNAALLYAFGGIKPVSVTFDAGIFLMFAYFLLVALFEEAMSRGYIQNALYISTNKPISAICASAAFSMLHFFNPSYSILAAANIFLVGIAFSMMAFKTGSLYAPIGFHWSWNFFQGNIYGIPVSGLSSQVTLITTQRVHDSIFNGGSFGAEGGLFCTLAIACTILYIAVFMKEGPANGELERLKRENTPNPAV